MQASLRPVSAVEGPLVDPEHVRRLRIEEPVERREHVDEQYGEPAAACVVERRQIGYGLVRGEHELVGEDRGLRNPGTPALGGRDQAVSRLVEEASPLELAQRQVRDEVEGVDLPVRMSDRGAYLGTPVLEHEHVVDVRPRPESLGALGPEIDHPACSGRAERPEGCVVIRRVQDHLAPLIGHGGPAIRKPANVVELGCLQAAGAKRAARLGQVRPGLTRAHDVGADARVDILEQPGLPVGHRALPG